MIRIVAGTLGGRRIATPPGSATRPSTERLRESIFQHLVAAVLPDGFDNLRVLDLFAGSGALAFEAVSRGAAHATLVDEAAAPLSTIDANIKSLRLQSATSVVRGRLPAALARIETGPFSVVFCDPPYDAGLLEPTLDALLARPDLLADGAIVVMEHRRGGTPLPRPALEILSVRKAGDTEVTIGRVGR